MRKSTMIIIASMLIHLKVDSQNYIIYDNGSVSSQISLGRIYMGKGQYADEQDMQRSTEIDFKKAAYYFEKAAKQGHPVAQYYLFYLYRHGGYGLLRNDSVAIVWLEKASEQGIAEYQCRLGNEYLKKDITKAEKWYRRAAEHTDDAYGVYASAQLYKYGLGVKRDIPKATSLIKKAAEKGILDAQIALAYYYIDRNGGNKDYNLSEYWFKEASIQGNFEPYIGLALVNGKKHHFIEAHSYIDKAHTMLSNREDAKQELIGCLGIKGYLYLEEGKKEDAIKIFDNCMDIDPNCISILKNQYLYKDILESFFSSIQNIKQIIDIDNPNTNAFITNKNTFAVIVANEHYKYEKDVQYAHNDGNTFRTYCNKVMGIPNENIHYITDATLNNIRYEVNWLKKVLNAYKGKGKAIFYYAGHGIPDEKNNQACMLPTDGYGNDAQTGYRLDNLYADLGEAPSQSTVVFLDACFSGTRRDGEMMTDVRGVAIKAKATNPTGNIIVFSAAQGDETAYPYDESKHGMFTFFLLNKLKETNGDVTLKELGDYISEKVSQKAIVSKGKSQTPTVMVSNSIGNEWTTWKLK